MAELEDPISSTEIILWCISLAILLTYFCYYVWSVLARSKRFVLTLNEKTLKSWTRYAMLDKEPGLPVFIVQTLRNSILTSSYFATSAITLAALTFNELIDRVNSEEANYQRGQLRIIQFSLVTAAFLLALINFGYAIRSYNYCSFLANTRKPPPQTLQILKDYQKSVNIPVEDLSPTSNVHVIESRSHGKIELDDERVKLTLIVTKMLQKASVHYSIGLRCFYLSVPLAIWILSPISLLVTSVILVFFLWKGDHA